MKKILVYSNMYPSDQKKYAGIFVKNQYEYLKKYDQSHSYTILALKREFTGLWGSIRKYLLFSVRSYSFINKKKVDIIHLHYFFPLAFIPWIFKKRGRSKTVVTIHGFDFSRDTKNPILFKIYKHFLKSFDYIICVGEDLKNDFEKKFKLKAHILSAGIDERVFSPLHLEKKFDFIFVGSLYKMKGFDIVLKIISKTLSMECKWCIVGSGEFESEIVSLTKGNPSQCTYYKSVSQTELNLLYNKSKWLFLPSREESFGLVASESIFAGTPVICSNAGGLKEQVFDNVNGKILDDLDDVDKIFSIISCCYSLSSYQYRNFVNNCSANNSKFSLSYVCNKLVDIYESL